MAKFLTFLCMIPIGSLHGVVNHLKMEDRMLWDDVSDTQVLRDMTFIEQQQISFDNELTDSECVCVYILAEKMDFDQFGISNEQDVTALENQLLESQMSASRLPLGSYQGPGMPMPSLKNNSVVLPSVSHSSSQPNFDLGFHLDSN